MLNSVLVASLLSFYGSSNAISQVLSVSPGGYGFERPEVETLGILARSVVAPLAQVSHAPLLRYHL